MTFVPGKSVTSSVAWGGFPGTYQSGESQLLMYEHAEKFDGTSRLILGLHGHGGDCTQFAQNHLSLGNHAAALARTGRYVVMAIDAGGPNGWSGPGAMTAISNAVAWAAAHGISTSRYGLLGYSMGGTTVANRIKRDRANIAAAWTWAGLLDLDYSYSTPGHSPVAGNATWTTEHNAAFGSYEASAGYRVWDEPQSFRGLGFPWRIVHAADDPTVPVSIPRKFVADVNDPRISYTELPTGGHVGLFPSVPTSDVVAHFDSGTWT